MKLNLTKLNERILDICPKVFVTHFPSKAKSLYKRILLTVNGYPFSKEVRETQALFREEGFPERIIKDVPLLIEEFNKAKPVLDRLAKNSLD